LRGWKGEVYEGGIRVPALANWPGVLEPRSLPAPMHIVDWMPTLSKLAGYSPETDLRWDGSDVWPLISGRAAAIEARSLYWKTPNAFAIRLGDWKLITGKQQKSFELYNVIADPYEEHDVARRNPERVNELRRLLEEVSAHDR
jgi:arylsulfatase A-like enzyme